MSQQLQQPQSHVQHSGYQPQMQSRMGHQPYAGQGSQFGYGTQQPMGHQQGQPQYGTTGMGQQAQWEQFGQPTGQRFEESVPNEVAQLVESLDRLETIAEWVKSRATHRGMGNLARTCDDVIEVVQLEKKLVVRQSPFAGSVGQAAKQVIQNAVSELQQHTDQPEVQQALSAAQQCVTAIDSAGARLQSAGQGQQFGQPIGQGQQFGGPTR